MPTIGQCEQEIKKLKKHVVELNKLKQSRHELTSMLKEAPLLFSEYTGNICPHLMEAVQKIDKQIALLEDPLFVVGEAPESQVNQRLAEEKPKPEISEFTLQIIKEHYKNNPRANLVQLFGVNSLMFGVGLAFPIAANVYFIPDLLKEHGL
jgi:hypothetical protein